LEGNRERERERERERKRDRILKLINEEIINYTSNALIADEDLRLFVVKER